MAVNIGIQGVGSAKRFLHSFMEGMKRLPTTMTTADGTAINRLVTIQMARDFQKAKTNSEPITMPAGILSRVNNFYNKAHHTVGRILNHTRSLARLKDTGRLEDAMTNPDSKERMVEFRPQSIAVVILVPYFKKHAFGGTQSFRFGATERSRFNDRVAKPPKRLRFRGRKGGVSVAMRKKIERDLKDMYESLEGTRDTRTSRGVTGEGRLETGVTYGEERRKLTKAEFKEKVDDFIKKVETGKADASEASGPRAYYLLFNIWKKKYPRKMTVKPRIQLTPTSTRIRGMVADIVIGSLKRWVIKSSKGQPFGG